MTLDEVTEEITAVTVEVFNPETPFGGVQVFGAADTPIQVILREGVQGPPGPPRPAGPIGSEGESGLTTARGTTPLIEGQSYIDVSFPFTQGDAQWVLLDCSILNSLDPSPLNIIPGILTVKTALGFRVQLSGLPDTGNYYLQWAISGSAVPDFPATTYAFSGPSSGMFGVDAVFTVQLPPGATLAVPVTVTPDDAGDGGVFTPASVVLSASNPTRTFAYTAVSLGEKTLSVTNAGSLIDPADITFTSLASTYTLSGPSSGTTGVASTNFTVALPASGVVVGTVTVTPSDGGGGGTFTPTTVSLTTGAPSATFTYTPASIGAKTISVTNDGGLTNPTDISYVVSAPFVPTDIAGLQVWLDADALGLTDGAAVSSWTDQSGSGNNFTGDAIHQIYKTSIVNGKPVVRFSAGGGGLLRNAAIANSQFTIFVVAAVSTIGSQGVFYASGQIGASSFYFLNNSGALYQGFFTSPGSPVTATEAAGLAVGVWNVLTTDWNGTNIHLWRNGTLKDTTGATTRGNTGNANSVGVAWTESFGVYEGDIAEVLVYDTALSVGDRDSVTAYLQSKYAL